MATTPGFSEALASGVVDVFTSAERLLLEKIARLVADGLDADRFEAQLSDIRRYRQAAGDITRHTATRAQRTLLEAIERAAQLGDASAVMELAAALDIPGEQLIVATPNVTALAAQSTGAITGATFSILPEGESIYRAVTREVINAPLLGVETREQAATRALIRYAQEGISVYTQRTGRRYTIQSYVETSLRSSLMNATLQGHSDRLEANGIDLVVVSNHSQECKLCRPFEGKVLALNGSAGEYVMPNPRTGDSVTVQVMATMREARRQGLFHPNCRHTYAAYLPGVTRDFGATADPQGDKDRQKLRRLERDKRALLHAQAAVKGLGDKADPAQVAALNAKIRAKNAQIREHVATTSAKRQPKRERISGNYS